MGYGPLADMHNALISIPSSVHTCITHTHSRMCAQTHELKRRRNRREGDKGDGRGKEKKMGRGEVEEETEEEKEKDEVEGLSWVIQSGVCKAKLPFLDLLQIKREYL